MPLVNTGAALGGMAVGAGRKLGGMISSKVDGANHVHAVAIQGLFNAHAQQQAHEHHLANVREAAKIAGGAGFNVRTGEHSTTIGKTKGGGKGEVEPAGNTGGGHDDAGRRTGPAEDHYENGRKFADGMHDRMRQIRDSGASENAQQIREGSATVKPMKELEGPRKALPAGSSASKGTPLREGGRDSVTAGPNVQRVNGAIPMENKGTTKIIDSKSPQEFMDTMEKNPQHFQNNASKRFDEIAARRQKDGTATFKE